MTRSPWLRVRGMQLAARLGLGFPTAPELLFLNLTLHTATRRLILQKTRCKDLRPRNILPVPGFRFCFTPLTGVLFTFPSRYYSLSVAAGI